MGFFDNLKKIKDYISGTGAELHIQLDTSLLSTEGRVNVKIFCQVKDNDLLIDKLYLKIKAQETVRYRSSNNVHSGSHRSHHSGGSTKTAYATTFKNEVIIDQNFRLDASGEYEWDASFTIPPNLPGTYIGVNARHEWQVLAGLSKKGNDPDSGWLVFEV